MQNQKKPSQTKNKLHPKNKHRQRYDFGKLINDSPELDEFVAQNKFGDDSIDFFNPDAVKALNTALLKHYYNIEYWDIPRGYLCPPIPGRADYLHYIADLLKQNNVDTSITPIGNKIQGLDIGVGANCIYPIIGNNEYGWSFIGSDTDEKAVESAEKIVKNNSSLKDDIEIRFQENFNSFFDGILNPNDYLDFTICNPPFHESAEEAEKASLRKLRNLKGKTSNKPVLNFGGKNNELWYKGGEVRFVKDMIYESRNFEQKCLWFTSLISKEKNLKPIYSVLKKVNAKAVKTITMGQGHKTSRFVAWTFLSGTEQRNWAKKRWQ